MRDRTPPAATRKADRLPGGHCLRTVGLLLALALLLAGGAARTQETQSPPAPVRVRPTPVLRAGIDVVTLTLTVTDAEGHLVTGLKKDDFQVFDDGAEQPITQFVDDRMPVSLGIALDVSESMVGRRIDDARLALNRFVSDLLHVDDEAFVLVFNHRPRMIVPWTLSPGQIAGRLDGVVPTGGTALYDAVLEALPAFGRRTHQRAALVVVSDGADTASDVDLKELRAKLRRSDAFVYALAIDAPTRRAVSGRVDVYALRDLTDDTGGYTEVVSDTSALDPATSRIADELNHQYLIGYVAPRGGDGQYHSVRVRTRDTALRVRTRKGYFAERGPS